MFNLNLDKIIDAINRLAAAIEDATATMKDQHKKLLKDSK